MKRSSARRAWVGTPRRIIPAHLGPPTVFWGQIYLESKPWYPGERQTGGHMDVHSGQSGKVFAHPQLLISVLSHFQTNCGWKASGFWQVRSNRGNPVESRVVFRAAWLKLRVCALEHPRCVEQAILKSYSIVIECFSVCFGVISANLDNSVYIYQAVTSAL